MNKQLFRNKSIEYADSRHLNKGEMINETLWSETNMAYDKAISDISEHYENLEKLIDIKNEYIKFLGEELGRNAGFLYTHGINCPQDVLDKGEDFRRKIKDLENKIIQ